MTRKTYPTKICLYNESGDILGVIKTIQEFVAEIKAAFGEFGSLADIIKILKETVGELANAEGIVNKSFILINAFSKLGGEPSVRVSP